MCNGIYACDGDGIRSSNPPVSSASHMMYTARTDELQNYFESC